MDAATLKIGANIQRLREARGLSRYRVALDVGTDWASVWRWETGRRLPDPHSLLRICHVLNCTVEAVFNGVVADRGGWRVEPAGSPAA